MGAHFSLHSTGTSRSLTIGGNSSDIVARSSLEGRTYRGQLDDSRGRYGATSRTTNEPGTIVGRGLGLSGVALGGGANSPVGR